MSRVLRAASWHRLRITRARRGHAGLVQVGAARRVRRLAAESCTCTEEGCAATNTNSRLTVRRLGDELVGVFQDAVFVNERNLRVPLGEVRLQRVTED